MNTNNQLSALPNKKIFTRNNWNNMLQVEIIPAHMPIPRYGVSRVTLVLKTDQLCCPLRQATVSERAAHAASILTPNKKTNGTYIDRNGLKNPVK